MSLFIIGIIISIPVGVLVNLCTPWVRNELAKRNSTRRAKRVQQIKGSLALIDDFRSGNHSNQLIALVAIRLVFQITLFSLAVLGMAMAGATYSSSVIVPESFQNSNLPDLALAAFALAILTLGVAGFHLYSMYNLFSSIFYKDTRYRKRAEQYLHKLGAPIIDGDHFAPTQGDLEDKAAADKSNEAGPESGSALSLPS